MSPDSPFVVNPTDGVIPPPTCEWIGTVENIGVLLSVDAVQKYLNRSRASVYRYANTDPGTLNPPYNPTKLNPEVRCDRDDPLEFRPQEVRRFAEEVLGLHPTLQVQPPEETITHDLMRQILQEMRAIRLLLERESGG